MSNNFQPIKENDFLLKMLESSLLNNNAKLISFNNVSTGVYGYYKYRAQIEYKGSILYSSCMLSESEAQDMSLVSEKFRLAIEEFEQIINNSNEDAFLNLIYYSLVSKYNDIVPPYSVFSEWSFIRDNLTDFIIGIKKSNKNRVNNQIIYDICLSDFKSFISKKI